MKTVRTTTALWTLALGLVLLGAVAGPAYADEGSLIEANVPFSFVVSNVTLPAGKYTIEQTEPDNVRALAIRQAEGPRSVDFITEDVSSGDQPVTDTKLVFDVIAGKTYLAQIWNSEDGTAQQLAKPDEMVRAEQRGERTEHRTVMGLFHRRTAKG